MNDRVTDHSRPDDPVRLISLWPAMRVHRDGCSDAAKSLANGHDNATRTNVDGGLIDSGSDVDSILAAIIADLNDSGDWDNPWRVSDLSLAPCVRDASKVVAPKPVPAGRCPGSGMPFNVSGPGSRWRPGARPMYDACPVCGHWYGTGRGVLPAHKDKRKVVPA